MTDPTNTSQQSTGGLGPSSEPSRGTSVPGGQGQAEIPVGVAVTGEPGKAGTVTARKAGGLRDMGLEVDPRKVGVKAALQHLAKAVNIAFQTDYGENYLESVYQAAIVRNGEVHIIHREYFGFGDTWFGQFGRLIRSMQLTLDGPDPASPEGQKRIAEKGPRTIRGILNLIGRKLDLVAEYEDRVPGLRRADVRPARGLGHHRRLEPRRLEHLDDDRRTRYPDLTHGKRGPARGVRVR